jgi:thiol-disulfide isomerase/thioredoxin
MTNAAFGRVLATCLLCALGACKQSAAPAPAPTPAPAPAPAPADQAAKKPVPEAGTWYRARLVFDGVGDLPFFLHVPPVGQSGRAYVMNGEEVTDFTAVWRTNTITITGPWNYVSVITAQKTTPGTLEGTWTRDTPLWGAVVRTFVATQIDAPDPRTRFPESAAAKPVDVSGTWHFQFVEHGDGKGAFEQSADGSLRGYVKPGQLGDLRFLAGNVRGSKFSLSQFNGNSANLVVADISADGTSMSGLMSMQNVWNEKFTAKKVDDYRFVNKVRLKDGKTTVTLQGLAKYKGKPTLAIIFATWCPSCNDAYPFFTQLYATYHPQGLEVLGVAYDLSEDEKSNRAQLDSFRAKHKVPWELLQEPCTPETWAASMPPEIEGWDGFPVIMLIKPDGTVQTIFGGWFGPATGAEGDKLRKWFEEETKKLVASAK